MSYRQNVSEVFNLGFDRERLVPEISETSGKLLCWSVVLMIVGFGPVVQHRHDVGVVVLVVVVERVEEDTQTIPSVGASKNRPLESLSWREPESQAVRSNSASASNAELDLHFPPVKGAAIQNEQWIKSLIYTIVY